MRTNTIYTDLNRLYQSSEQEASLIVRLMLACNDIALANHCLSNYRTKQLRKIEKHTRRGALMYFVRLQFGHLNEVMFLISELQEFFQKNSLCLKVFNNCTEETKNDFYQLRNCLEGFPNRKEFLNKVELLRHNTVFHYNANKLFERAIKRRSENQIGRYSSITRSNDLSSFRFEVADDIVDTVVCRFLWKIEGDEELQAKADEASDFGSNLSKAFIYFCEEFIFRYMKAHGTRR